MPLQRDLLFGGQFPSYLAALAVWLALAARPVLASRLALAAWLALAVRLALAAWLVLAV